LKDVGNAGFSKLLIRRQAGNVSRAIAITNSDFAIKGISTVSDLSMINLEGAGMIGVPGTAQRVFFAMQHAGISVVVISQASSEHSICFVVHQNESEKALDLLRDEFARELDAGKVQSISASDNCAVLAVVGDSMTGQPGVAAKFFEALARASVNIKAIAQGSSERNISAVINADQLDCLVVIVIMLSVVSGCDWCWACRCSFNATVVW